MSAKRQSTPFAARALVGHAADTIEVRHSYMYLSCAPCQRSLGSRDLGQDVDRAGCPDERLGVGVVLGQVGVVVLILQIGALWVEKSLCDKDKDLRARTFCARAEFGSR